MTDFYSDGLTFGQGYHSYDSAEQPEEVDNSSQNLERSDTKPSTGQEKRGQTMLFPMKLHRLLETVERSRESAHIVSWCGHGRAFVVHHKDAFVRRFLPR